MNPKTGMSNGLVQSYCTLQSRSHFSHITHILFARTVRYRTQESSMLLGHII